MLQTLNKKPTVKRAWGCTQISQQSKSDTEGKRRQRQVGIDKTMITGIRLIEVVISWVVFDLFNQVFTLNDYPAYSQSLTGGIFTGRVYAELP